MAKQKYYQRPDGLFETTRTINDRRVRFRGRTCKEVDRKILEYREDVKRGRPFPVVADEWYALHEKEIAYSTYLVYGYALKLVKAAFPTRCSEIRPIDLKRYLNEFEGRGYAKKTVQIEVTVIKQIFSHAVLQGDVDVSPAVELRMSRNLPGKTRTALTEEQERLVETCRKGDWWLLGLMLLYTGCRRGELLALEWKDVDRKAGVIHVTKKLNYAYGNTPHLEHHLKSENGKRDIPLLKPLADALPKSRVGLIFANEAGTYLKNRRSSTSGSSIAATPALSNARSTTSVTSARFSRSRRTASGIRSRRSATRRGSTPKPLPLSWATPRPSWQRSTRTCAATSASPARSSSKHT